MIPPTVSMPSLLNLLYIAMVASGKIKINAPFIRASHPMIVITSGNPEVHALLSGIIIAPVAAARNPKSHR